MKRDWIDTLAEDEIVELCLESAKLLRRVQRRADNDFSAWLVTLELIQRASAQKNGMGLNASVAIGERQHYVPIPKIRSEQDLRGHRAPALTYYELADKYGGAGY